MPVKKIKVKLPKAKVVVKKTYVAIVLDRSGSMTSIQKETVDGLNEQFAALRRDSKLAGDTEVTLIQFDDKIDVILKEEKAANLKDWNYNDFQPRGMTAMNDAVWNAINILKSKTVTDDTGFLICVISDGAENASKEVTQSVLSEEIKRLQNTGNWTFTYMLANQDIHAVSKQLNVNASNMASFTANSAGSINAYANNARGISSYLGARGQGAKSVEDFYNNAPDTNTTA